MGIIFLLFSTLNVFRKNKLCVPFRFPVDLREIHACFLRFVLFFMFVLSFLGYPIQDSQHEISSKIYRMKFPLQIFSHYFFPLLVSNCRLKISTASPLCPKYLQDNIITFISTCNSNTVYYPRLPLVCTKYPGTIQYNLYNSIGYEQTLCRKNLQLTGLKYTSITYQYV